MRGLVISTISPPRPAAWFLICLRSSPGRMYGGVLATLPTALQLATCAASRVVGIPWAVGASGGHADVSTLAATRSSESDLLKVLIMESSLSPPTGNRDQSSKYVE